MDTTKTSPLPEQYALAIQTINGAISCESAHMRKQLRQVVESQLLDPYFQVRLQEEIDRLDAADRKIRECVWDPETGGAWESYWRNARTLSEECRILQEGAFLRYGYNADRSNETRVVFDTIRQAVDEIVASYHRICGLIAALGHEYARIAPYRVTVSVTSVPRFERIEPPASLVYERGVEEWDRVAKNEATSGRGGVQ